jgi:hypothetical protein
VAGQLGLEVEQVPLPTLPPLSPPSGSLSELYRSPRRFWETVIIWGGSSTAAYGVYLWGPTIVALLLGIPVPQAAGYFVLVAGSGVVGKIVVTFISPLIGRRICGVLFGFIAAGALAAAAVYNSAFIGGCCAPRPSGSTAGFPTWRRTPSSCLVCAWVRALPDWARRPTEWEKSSDR